MFKTGIKPTRSSVVLFIGQILLLPPLFLICGFGVGAVVPGPDSVSNNIIYYLLFSSIGLVGGLLVWSYLPDIGQSGGRWIWIPVATGVVFLIVEDWIQLHARYGSTPILVDWFLPSLDPAGGEAAWAWLFVTLPAVSCVSYSLTIAARMCQSRPR
jgi:hypothetical protein